MLVVGPPFPSFSAEMLDCRHTQNITPRYQIETKR
jgi:hypothetical protein